MITLEKIDVLLNHPNIELVPMSSDTEIFNRHRQFFIHCDGRKDLYKITWYINQGYLFTHKNNVTIPFGGMETNGTWPHKSKKDLRFLDERGELVAIVKLESWPD